MTIYIKCKMLKCSKCKRDKPSYDFEGFKQCLQCRMVRRRWYENNKEEHNEKRKVERAKHTRLCEECNMKVRHENWEVHFHYAQHPNSELNNQEKAYFEKLLKMRRDGTLTDEIREEMKEEYKRERHEIYKKLNKLFPDRYTWAKDTENENDET